MRPTLVDPKAGGVVSAKMMRHGGAVAAASEEQQASLLRELVGSDDAMALVVAMLGPCGARSCAEALLLARMVPGVRFWSDDLQLLPSAADWMSSVRDSFGAKLQGFEAMPRDWITQAVRDWYEQEQWSRAMLLVGKPGTGKSVAAATLALHGSDSVVVGAAHCFDAADPDSCDLRKAYASIAAQLATTVPGLAEQTQSMNAYVASMHVLSSGEVFDRFIARPCWALASALAPDQRIVIVLDGIDECDDEHRPDLLFLLETSFQAKCPDWLGFLSTSRRGVAWRESFHPTLLVLDEQRTLEDLRGFLHTRLAPLLSGVDIAHAVEELAERSLDNGGFLHARFAIVKVASQSPTVLTDVASFPSSMAGVYAQAFSSFKGEVLGGSNELYTRIFATLVAARSPVPLSLLGEVLRTHVRSAVNLLVVDTDGRVRFVHHRSMADWLKSSSAAEQGLAVKAEDGNVFLAELCLEHPTNRFALRHALFHLCKAGRAQEAAGLLLDVSWLLEALQDKAVDSVALVVDAGPFLDNGDWQVAADVLRVLEKGANALRNDPRELASQLYGRLQQGHPALRGVKDHYQQLGLSWLEPVVPCFEGSRTLGTPVQIVSVAAQFDVIVSSSGRTLKVWKASTGELLHILEEPSGAVGGVAFAPELDLIVTGSMDHKVRVWKASTGELQWTLLGHQYHVTCVAVSPELDVIVSGARDSTVKVWKASTGELLRTLEGHVSSVRNLGIAPGLNMILCESGRGTKAWKAWKASTGELLQVLQEERSTPPESLQEPWSPETGLSELGVIVGPGRLSKMLLWDPVTGRRVTRDSYQSHRRRQVVLLGCTASFTTDADITAAQYEGGILAVGTCDGRVHSLVAHLPQQQNENEGTRRSSASAIQG